jgi:hypothetical protein
VSPTPTAQKRSLEVDFTDLGNGQLAWAAALAVFAADAPRATLALLDDAATQVCVWGGGGRREREGEGGEGGGREGGREKEER